MKWLYYWLDLCDSRGKPDNQKILPLVVVIAALVANFVHNPFSVTALIVLGAIAFGPRVYGLFLRYGLNSSAINEVNKAIYARREDGEEPA